MIRIISGNLKGKKIIAPNNFDVRPTTDFAKEALFSIINNQYILSQISVLNLFSGIGSIDYEFASRGCKDITSVEINVKHVKFIVETLKKLDIQEQVNIIRQDVFSFIQKPSFKLYDLVFADPPFNFTLEKYEELINLIINNNFLADSGQLILEHNPRIKFSGNSNLVDNRKYGNISFSFFKKI
ncbi:RsmD family RNA methyltransferase [Apibacter adventoris]|uniref:16S rRNA (Guanine(966)-N(2))-methyltransferase RsmD n=1 Tax=Apibacter adventoris TaxID=1679466 RepID=A0A2S8AEF9_9FLAO|nr:RsmD family RNA methyltransferase [Apibacter adventoris]PQL93474.1 16S rRNA (guanine(966)-N(2))-methyltransferase RsmD [Apibacter adventoris]